MDINEKMCLSGNFFAKRILIDVCIGATLQIGHDCTIDFLVKEFDSYWYYKEPLRRAYVDLRSYVDIVNYFCVVLVQVLLSDSRPGCAQASPV